MPFRISQALLDTSIYLYPDQASAEKGMGIGGSGFVAGIPIEGLPGFCSIWAVTNKHIIDSGHWTIRLNIKDGGTACLDTVDTEWFAHPDGDDLVVRPLAVPQNAALNFVPIEMMLTKQVAHILDIGAGDAAFVIGRFVALDGKQKNTPSVRFGQISQKPSERLQYNEFDQELWLVEVKSLNGYSGSPVFCWLDPMYFRDELKGAPGSNPQLGNSYDHKGQIMGRGRFETGPFLLGVDCCMIPLWQKVCDSGGTELQGGTQVPLNTGMMGVIPSWRLVDLLACHPHKAVHEERARQYHAAKPGAIATLNPS